MIGGGAMLAGAVFLGIGLYRDVGPASAPTVPEEPVAVKYRGDPGGVYDRPVVSAHAPSLPSAATEATAAAAAAAPPLRDAPFRMLISKLGVDAGAFPYGLDENRIPLVPLNPWDVAWYTFSAKPGTGGNAVFAGHVTWNGAAVFYNLDQLALGDTIVLRGEDGTELLYTVAESFAVDPADPDALAVMGPTNSDMVTIITCDGSFYYTGDPVFGGDYTKRRVIRASLTSMTPPAAPSPPAGANPAAG
jgi:LPXTG-site transpeptidase (sortase) family protein